MHVVVNEKNKSGLALKTCQTLHYTKRRKVHTKNTAQIMQALLFDSFHGAESKIDPFITSAELH